MEKIFYQDFIFKDMPTDERDYPQFELNYAASPLNCLNYQDIKAKKADYYSGFKIKIALTELMSITKAGDWQALEDYLLNCKELYIVDDIFLKNEEAAEHKLFWLKSYCCRLSRFCPCIIAEGAPPSACRQLYLHL